MPFTVKSTCAYHIDNFAGHGSAEQLSALDGLLLALAEAAAYMNETGTQFAKYTGCTTSIAKK
jgi:hypothetical protein